MNSLRLQRKAPRRNPIPATPPAPGRAAALILSTLILLVAPLDESRATTLLEVSVSGPNANLTWNSVPGNTYVVQSRDSLSAGSWITNATVVAEDNMTLWTDPTALVSTRFYRLLMPAGEQTLFESPQAMPPGAPGEAFFRSVGGLQMEAEVTDYKEGGVHKGGKTISGFSGEFKMVNVDVRVFGRGLDFIWARIYRSRVGPNTAQGNGWDFSYNIWVRRVSSHVEVHDGNSRRDVYLLQTNGTFACDGFFREGSISNDAFTLTFADKGSWEFHSFDHATSPGKIRRSTDRNGNAMEFQYDGLSRLVRVIDTLGRTNTVSYDANGFISAVTDFSGRQVRYEYYGNSDQDGSLGDLKFAVSPAVTGTPNANDFPGGKTNRYTYSKGLTPEALNHNLLTVTDGKGQMWLSNRYHTATSPTSLNYDRIEIPIEIVALNLQSCNPVYVPITPGPTNNGASKKTIVNDRVGNVREYFYDAGNRLVMQRAFTGRAFPGQFTTETQNRPMNPLRATDPAYFETRIEWNKDSLPTRVVHPGTNETRLVYESALNPSASQRLRGNLRERHRLPGPLGGDQIEIVESFEYAPGFGTARSMDGGHIVGCYQMEIVPQMWLLTGKGAPPGIMAAQVRGFSDILVNSYSRSGAAREPIAAQLGVNIVDYIDNDDYMSCVQYRETAFNFASQQGGDLKSDGKTEVICSFGDVDGDSIRDVGWCSFASFPSAVTDARGNVTTRSYDARGNCTNVVHRIPSSTERYEYNAFGQLTAHVLPQNNTGHRRRDEFNYYPSGVQNGYLQNVIVDAATNALTTTYEYDALGRVVRRIDPGAQDTLYSVNALGQTVRVTSPEVTTGSGIRYQRDYFYDANNNVVRVDVQNRDETGTLGANKDFTRTYEYDSLNRLIRSTREVDAGQTITNEFAYDANSHRSLWRSGLAVSGVDTNNIVQSLYDERDLPFRQIRGPGGTNQSTAQRDYDPNGNLRRTQHGLEGAPRQTDYVYDGFNRAIRGTNALGSLTTWHYDPNGNLTSSRFDGETNDVAGAAGNLRLSETTFQYDAMNRLIQRDRAFFDITSQLSIGDGQSTTQFGYDNCSHLIALSDDVFNQMFASFDSANRLAQVTDARGNTFAVSYDDETGNAIQIWNVEKSDLGNPDQNYTNTYAYDNLNRCTQAVDSAGIINQFAYDSRSQRVLATDGLGISTRYEYDGLGRLVRTVRDMNANGPSAAEAADIVNNFGYDASSRRTGVTDDNTNTTRYVYDSLDRLTREDHADNTTNRYAYDPRNNLIQQTDAQGTVVTNSYDLLDRRTARRVTTSGAGVTGPALELFAYDGLSRLVQANSSTAFISQRYDSLGNLVAESQQPSGALLRTVTASFDGAGNRTQLVYPGGRTNVFAYDTLNRVKSVHDFPAVPATLIASNSYVGRHRVERVDYGNATRLDVGYDVVRRVAATTHTSVPANMVIDARAYTWNNAHNKTVVQEPAGVHNYAYDAANRLTVSVAPLSMPEIYQLDGVGNRLFVNGPVDPGNYTMNPTLPEPADSQVNQYTSTPFDGRTYNRNGNLTNSVPGPRNFAYDSRNQLTMFLSPGINVTCEYDPLGRRLEKSVNGQITRYYYDGRRVIEEQNQANATVATYGHANQSQSREVLAMDADTNNDGDPDQLSFTLLVSMQRGGQNFYFHTDDLGSVVKVTDQTGAVVEQYQYADYGVPNGPSAIGNPYLFHGQRYEPESGLYYATANLDSVEYGEWNYQSAVHVDPRAGRSLTHNSTGIGNNPASRNYCVQYRETAFNFASRLMEEEGIFYFFSHSAMSGRPGIQCSIGDFFDWYYEWCPRPYGPELPPDWFDNNPVYHEEGILNDSWGPFIGPWGPGPGWDWEKGDWQEFKAGKGGNEAAAGEEGCYVKG